jgi:hypothetical protein
LKVTARPFSAIGIWRNQISGVEAFFLRKPTSGERMIRDGAIWVSFICATIMRQLAFFAAAQRMGGHCAFTACAWTGFRAPSRRNNRGRTAPAIGYEGAPPPEAASIHSHYERRRLGRHLLTKHILTPSRFAAITAARDSHRDVEHNTEDR